MNIDVATVAAFVGILAVAGGFYWWSVQQILASTSAVGKANQSIEKLRGELELIKVKLEHRIDRNEWEIDQIENFLDREPDIDFHKRAKPKS